MKKPMKPTMADVERSAADKRDDKKLLKKMQEKAKAKKK